MQRFLHVGRLDNTLCQEQNPELMLLITGPQGTVPGGDVVLPESRARRTGLPTDLTFTRRVARAAAVAFVGCGWERLLCLIRPGRAAPLRGWSPFLRRR